LKSAQKSKETLEKAGLTNHADYESNLRLIQLINKKISMNDHSKRRRIVIVKVEPKEAKIYDELIQKREFLEDTIDKLEQKKTTTNSIG